jgi:hypothetical protein
LSGEITGSVSLSGRVDDASGEVSKEGVQRVEVVGPVVIEVDLSEGGVGQCLGLVSEENVRDIRVGGEHEDPQVAFQRDPSPAESELAQPLEVVVDLGGKQPSLAGGKFAQSPLGVAQASDAGGEVAVDVGQGALESLIRCRLKGSDPRERDSGFGQGADLDQVNGLLGGVTPVSGGVTVGLSQESLVVVDADGLGRHTRISGELSDGDHNPMVSQLTLPLGQGCNMCGMTNMNADRETLRALADEGNEMALDRLADLGDQREDLAELNDLLDEGCVRAGQLLTARAVTQGDLRELQRLSDAGCDEAGHELDRLLAGPTAGGPD